MTRSEFESDGDQASYGAILVRRVLIGIGGGLALVFLAGVLAGYLGVAVEQARLSLTGAVVLALIVGLITAVAYGMWRFWPRTAEEPVAPRVRSARNLLAVMVALGVPLGILLGIADSGPGLIFSNGRVSPLIATSAIIIWIGAAPLLTLLWWRKIDEHEADAYRDGALVAAHAYLFIAPAWWMATRAGWLPPQDPMLMMLAIACIWSVVWVYRRYF